MHAVSIVIPVYNAFEAAATCLDNLYRARTDIPFEVIAVDNGSAGRLDEYVGPDTIARPNLRVMRFEQPLGFPRAVNEGARLARHDYIVLLNSDTLVTDWWLDHLIRALASDPTLAVVSPVTNRCGHDAQIARDDRTGIILEPQALNFFCVMIRRAVWDQLGGLDEIYRTGYFEDDDFCLRARLAGFRLAIVPSAFVSHEANKTFEANRLNKAELLARNQAIFYERASRSSRVVAPAPPMFGQSESISVIVPVLPSTLSGLRDSLASLSNQTVSGFEAVLVQPPDVDVSPAVAELSGRMRITVKTIAGTPTGTAALLNAGLDAARGRRIAYLIPGDVFYPFHLEVLSNALEQSSIDAAYCAWSVCLEVGGKERRAAVSFDQAEPIRLPWGDWAPLICWLHKREATPSSGFDESFRHFPGWGFVLQLTRRVRVQYLRRVTVERRLQPEPISSPSAVLEAERILGTATELWQLYHRKEFLDAVRKGCWEHHLVIDRNQVQRRARQLVGGDGLARFHKAQLDAARARLEDAGRPTVPTNRSALPNIFLFSIIEWTALTQRPQHFARGLAARGYRVFWIDVRLRQPRLLDAEHLASELAPGLYHVELPGEAADIYRLNWSPDVLDLMAHVIERIHDIYPAESAIQLVTFPKWTPLAARLRDRFGWPIVYDCLDDQQAFAQMYKHDASAFEDDLVRASSVVIVAAQSLFERQQPRLTKTTLLPNAADYETFHSAKPGGVFDDIRHPLAGFYGAFADWLDFDWIAEAARHFPDWSFVYIGLETFATDRARARWNDVAAAPNIMVLPQMDIPKLARHLAEFDVCIMPFQDLPVTRAMNPVKIYEYLAAGKPVVVPELPETSLFARQGLIRTYTSRDESFRLLEEAVIRPASAQQIGMRQEFAAANTWPQRLDVLVSLFQGLAR